MLPPNFSWYGGTKPQHTCECPACTGQLRIILSGQMEDDRVIGTNAYDLVALKDTLAEILEGGADGT